MKTEKSNNSGRRDSRKVGVGAGGRGNWAPTFGNRDDNRGRNNRPEVSAEMKAEIEKRKKVGQLLADLLEAEKAGLLRSDRGMLKGSELALAKAKEFEELTGKTFRTRDDQRADWKASLEALKAERTPGASATARTRTKGFVLASGRVRNTYTEREEEKWILFEFFGDGTGRIAKTLPTSFLGDPKYREIQKVVDVGAIQPRIAGVFLSDLLEKEESWAAEAATREKWRAMSDLIAQDVFDGGSGTYLLNVPWWVRTEGMKGKFRGKPDGWLTALLHVEDGVIVEINLLGGFTKKILGDITCPVGLDNKVLRGALNNARNYENRLAQQEAGDEPVGLPDEEDAA